MDLINRQDGMLWQDQTIAKWHEQLQETILMLAPTIYTIAEELYAIPELAYNEHLTSRYIQKWMSKCSVHPMVVAYTGVVGDLGMSTPHIGVIADMDAIELQGTRTHACGHHAQLVHLLGLLLVFSAVTPICDFGLRLIAAPAEELTTSAERNTRLRDGQVLKASGKAWLAEEGAFDGLSTLLCCHLADNQPERSITLGYTTEGCVALILALAKPGFSRTSEALWKLIQHQTSSRNAGVSTVKRVPLHIETIVELGSLSDGIVTVYIKGTTSLGEKQICTELGAANFQELVQFSEELAESIQRDFYEQVKVVEICKAYAPLNQDASITRLFAYHAAAAGYSVQEHSEQMVGYTDLGFLSQRLAVCHPMVGGTVGFTHSPEFRVVDPFAAYIMPIQALCGTIVDLVASRAM